MALSSLRLRNSLPAALVLFLALYAAQPLPAQEGPAFEPRPGDTLTYADYQEQHGNIKFLKGRVEIRTDEFVVTAGEANLDEATEIGRAHV